MSRLDGQVAIVTGSSKGIGAGIAKGMGAAGAKIVVNYASDKAGADRTVSAIRENGGEAIAVQADVSKEDDVRRMFAEANKAFGTVDTLVNSAGVFALGPVESVTEAEFRRHVDTNILGIFFTIQQALAQFGDKGGNIINVSSAGTSFTGPMTSLYMMTKGALIPLTRVLAKELAPRNVRVNALAPGSTETEGVRETGVIGNEGGEFLVAGTPLGRWGQPEDIAPAAVFLASDDARWITGELMYVSGGQR